MRLVSSCCAVVALTLFAVACGGSDDKGSAPSGANQPSSSTATAGGNSGGSSGGTSAAAIDPCTALNKVDAAATLGKPVLDGKLTAAKPPLGQALCFYGAEDARSESVQLSVITTAGIDAPVRQGGQNAKTMHNGLKGGLTNVVAVPGIGQDAFIAGTSIYVLKNETSFSILLTGNGRPGDASHTEALKTAANKVAAKMP